MGDAGAEAAIREAGAAGVAGSISSTVGMAAPTSTSRLPVSLSALADYSRVVKHSLMESAGKG